MTPKQREYIDNQILTAVDCLEVATRSSIEAEEWELAERLMYVRRAATETLSPAPNAALQ